MYGHSDRNSRSDSAAWYGSCIDIAIETQGLTVRPGMAHVST